MILTPKIQRQIIGEIKKDPTAAVVLPEHAYGSGGRVTVLVDGLPTPLHRHLYTVLIGPLADNQKMHDRSGVTGNVNPHLFDIVTGSKSPATHCPNDHPYEGNEMPANSRGYRCRKCYEASLARRRKRDGEKTTNNVDKTHCPQNHPYDEKNTIIDSAGRRRCKICRRNQARKYMQSIRTPRKETS